MPGCDGTGTAERSYPASEVRGGGREETPQVQGQGGGREELPRIRGQWQRLGGATPNPRSGAVAGRRHPRSEIRGGQEKPLVPEARSSDLEEPPRAEARGSSWVEPPTSEARAGGREEQPGSSGCAGTGGPRGAIPR